jgi:uncharacterized glyoxalase superfamily protein PhnB
MVKLERKGDSMTVRTRWLIAFVTLGMFVSGVVIDRAWAHDPDPNDPLQAAIPVLKVPDITKAAAYYTDVLGFHLEFTAGEPPTYGSVSRGKVEFHLSTGSGAIEKGSIYIIVKGVDKLHESLKAKGAEIPTAPTNQPYGMREFSVKTPAGHVLIFGEAVQQK